MVKEVKELRDVQDKTTNFGLGALSGLIGLAAGIATFLLSKFAYDCGGKDGVKVSYAAAKYDPNYQLQIRETED